MPRPRADTLAIGFVVTLLVAAAASQLAAERPGKATPPSGTAAPRVSVVAAPPKSFSLGDWPMYLQNPERSAAQGADTVLNTGDAPGVQGLWSFAAGAPVVASPI